MSQKNISETLMKVGLACHLLGFQYIKEAVELVIKDRNLLHGLTTHLYPAIAKKFNSNPARVERAIRHAKDLAWREPVESRLCLGPCANKSGITNGEFIATLVEQIRMNSMKDVG